MTANVGADEFQTSPGLNLFGISLSSKTLGIILAVVGVGLAAYGTATQTLPLYDSLEQIKSQIAQKRASVETKQKEVLSKGDVPQKVIAAQQRNKEVLALLPSADSMDVLLRDLNAQIPPSISVSLPGGAFEVKGLFEEFRPVAGDTKGGDAQFSTRRFDVRFSATYPEAIETLKKIERLKPLLVVQDLKMVPNTNIKVTVGEKDLSPEQQKAILSRLPPLLATSFKLIAYVPLSDAEIKALEAAKKPEPPKKK